MSGAAQWSWGLVLFIAALAGVAVGYRDLPVAATYLACGALLAIILGVILHLEGE